MKKKEARPQVLTGRAGVGKTTCCLEMFRQNLLKSPQSGLNQPSYYILPSNEHRDRILSLLLRERGLSGILNHHVLTIRDFVRLKTRGAGRRPMSHFERAWILRRVLEEPGWKWLERSRLTRGAPGLMADFVREAKAALLTPEDFEKASEKAGSDTLFKRKRADLVRLLRSYDAACAAAGAADPEDEVASAARVILEGGSAPFIELAVFDGFFDFTEAQLLFVRAIAKASRRAIVALTLDEARPALFRYPLETQKRLLSHGFEETSLDGEAARFRSPELASLERRLFAEKRGDAPGPRGAVELIEERDERREAETIAREILAGQRGRGLYFSDFMVVLRDLQPYRRYLEEAFGELDIPYEIHERRRLSEHPLARFLSGWLAVFASPETRGVPFEESAFLDFLREPYLRLDARHADEIERALAREAGEAGPDKLKAVLRRKELSPTAHAALSALLDRGDAFAAAGRSKELRAFFLQWLGELRTATDDEASACADEICEVLEALAPDPRAESRPEFLARFAASLDGGLFSTEHADLNRVQVYDASLAVQKEYRVVFVAGLSRGRFPRASAESVVLRDAERRVMAAAGTLFDTLEMRDSGERYYFYMACTRARDKLYLTRNVSDAQGGDVAASVFFEEARAASGVVPRRDVRGPEDVLPAPAEALTPRDVRRQFFYASGCRTAGTRAFAERLAVAAGLPAAEWEEEASRATRENHIAEPELLASFAAAQGPFSASGLETLSNCGYRYFADRSLRLSRESDPSEEMQSGIVLHDVLKHAFQTLRNTPFSAAALERACAERLEAAFAENEVPGERPHRAAMRKARLADALRGYCIWEARRAERFPGYSPREFEWSFGVPGADGTAPDAGPLEIDTPRGRLKLIGRIDRIDVSADGKRALVIDYKSGNLPTYESLKRGEEPQAAAYLMAARELLKLEPVGIEFVSLSKRETRGIYRDALTDARQKYGRLEESEYEELMDFSRRGFGEAVKRLREADIRVRPESVMCGYCDYHGLCRFEDWRERA